MNHTLLCLHGWGGSKKSFDTLRSALVKSNLQILTPDLPGFGEEADPSAPWTVSSYAEWVADYIQKKVHGSYSLLGHSHGGRISIKLVTSILQQKQIPMPKHLYLCASAGIRHPKHTKRAIGLVLSKTGKIILSAPGASVLQPLGKKILYKLMGVHDYEKASNTMKQTLVNVSRENLRPLLSAIDIPTDIFWGEEDSMTPISDAHIMNAEIKKSTLYTFKHVRHGVHKEKAQDIAKTIIMTSTKE